MSAPVLNYHESWEPVLGPVIKEVWPELSARLADVAYLPAAEHVFRAFQIPFEDVRVLIVGQDPYPTPGHAMGLAFSTAPGVKPPRSLVNIYAELAEDVGVTGREDGDLSAWERQGIMLLNRVLTVEPGNAGAHRRWGWEKITAAAIAALNRQPMVAILWGKDAQGCAPLLTDVPVIASPHPSPLSARRGFFGSRPFSTVNRYLADQNCPPVRWDL